MSSVLEGDSGNYNDLLGATVGQTIPLETNPLESTPIESTPIEATTFDNIPFGTTTPIESTPIETTPVIPVTTTATEINPFGNIPIGTPNAQYDPRGPNQEYVIVGYIEVDQLSEEYKGLIPTVKVTKLKIVNQTLNPEVKTKNLQPKDEFNKLKPVFPPGTEPFQIANF